MVGFEWWGWVEFYDIMCAMRPLRNFKANQCCQLTGRIANRELRASLGIASANFFTAHCLTPLAKDGCIAVVGGDGSRYRPDRQHRLLRKGKAVVCA